MWRSHTNQRLHARASSCHQLIVLWTHAAFSVTASCNLQARRKPCLRPSSSLFGPARMCPSPNQSCKQMRLSHFCCRRGANKQRSGCNHPSCGGGGPGGRARGGTRPRRVGCGRLLLPREPQPPRPAAGGMHCMRGVAAALLYRSSAARGTCMRLATATELDDDSQASPGGALTVRASCERADALAPCFC